MSVVTSVLKKSFLSVFNKQFFILVVVSLLITALVLTVFVTGVEQLFMHVLKPWVPTTYPLIEKFISFGTAGGSILIAYILFPSFVPLIAGLCENKVATSIERINYPDIIATHPTSLRQDIQHGLKFTGMILLINCLCLPLYLIPIVNFFTYVPINAYLIGRECFFTVAVRYVTWDKAKLVYAKNRFIIWTVGALLLIFSYLPFIKLLAPFIAVAMMVHLFQELRHTQS